MSWGVIRYPFEGWGTIWLTDGVSRDGEILIKGLMVSSIKEFKLSLFSTRKQARAYSQILKAHILKTPLNFDKPSQCSYCKGKGKIECDECGSLIECYRCEGTGEDKLNPQKENQK